MVKALIVSILISMSLARLGAGQELNDGKAKAGDMRGQEISNYFTQFQDYRIAAGDMLEIQVVGAPELTQTTKISASGDINFLPVGSIHATDLTAAELEQRLAAILQENRLVMQPQVLVFIREYHAKRVYATGEFVRSGEFIMSKYLSVTDTILLAGGLTQFADRYAYLHHSLSKDQADKPPPAEIVSKPDVSREGIEIIKIDLQPFLDGRLPEPDVLLQQGDYLIVPRRLVQYYYVIGEVMAPLNYVYPLGRTLMASQAISSAGGPTPIAKMSKGMIVRSDGNGKRQEVKVDFAAILKSKQADIRIEPNDIIYIPGSSAKQILEGYILATNAMIASTAFAVGRQYQLPDQPSSGNNSGN